jgi:N-acylneuraminate cytidylyltransferase
MVVSVMQAATNPYYNAFETDENGFLHISKGDGKYTRRQDAPKVWEYNGAVYVINTASLRKMKLGEFTRRKMYEMSRERSIDLDTPTDWLIAETLIRNNL